MRGDLGGCDGGACVAGATRGGLGAGRYASNRLRSRLRSRSSPNHGGVTNGVIGGLMFIIEGCSSVTDDSEEIDDAGERLRVILRLKVERNSSDMVGGAGLCIFRVVHWGNCGENVGRGEVANGSERLWRGPVAYGAEKNRTGKTGRRVRIGWLTPRPRAEEWLGLALGRIEFRLFDSRVVCCR